MESSAIHEEHDASEVSCQLLLSESQARHSRSDYEGEIADLTKVIELSNASAKMKVRALYLRGFAFEAMGDFKSALSDTTLAKKILDRLKGRNRVGTFGLRVALKKRLAGFDDFIERLRLWMEIRGYLPWAKGQTLEERQLAKWVSSMRTYRGKLSDDAINKIENIQGWTWEARSSIEPLSSSDSAEESYPSPLRRTRRQDVDSDIDSNRKETETKLFHAAQMKLSAELARNTDLASRRLCLRRWQLMFHPDKNPDKADEVLPIFRLVMSLWNRDHRISSNSKTSTEQARAKNSPHRSRKKERCEQNANGTPTLTESTPENNLQLTSKAEDSFRFKDDDGDLIILTRVDGDVRVTVPRLGDVGLWEGLDPESGEYSAGDVLGTVPAESIPALQAFLKVLPENGGDSSVVPTVEDSSSLAA